MYATFGIIVPETFNKKYTQSTEHFNLDVLNEDLKPFGLAAEISGENILPTQFVVGKALGRIDVHDFGVPMTEFHRELRTVDELAVRIQITKFMQSVGYNEYYGHPALYFSANSFL